MQCMKSVAGNVGYVYIASSLMGEARAIMIKIRLNKIIARILNYDGRFSF